MTTNATLPPKSPALARPVDVLFARLAMAYGKHWIDMWVGMPLDAVKSEWAASLASVKAHQVESALQHLGKFPPTLPEFKSLCDQFRKVGPPVLAVTDSRREPMPDKVREQLAKFNQKFETKVSI